MVRGFNQFGLFTVFASLLVFTACGDTGSDEGDVLSELLAPEIEDILVNPTGAEPVEVTATVTRSDQISRSDARTIAQVMLNQVHLPDQAFATEIDSLRGYNPHVQVVELPSFENDNLYKIQRVFSAQGYICRPDDNQFNEYVNIVCVRADAQEQDQQQ